MRRKKYGEKTCLLYLFYLLKYSRKQAAGQKEERQCPRRELRAMEQRYDVALLLDQGLVYTEILEKTGASSATISRVNRIFSFGTGGFRRMIERRKARKQ